MEVWIQKTGLEHLKQKATCNSNRACRQSSSFSIRLGIIPGYLSQPGWSHCLPDLFPYKMGPIQHFGLISPHRCCLMSLPASFGSVGCLPGPLTVGCYNNIQQMREAWRSSGWARWRGGGRTDSWTTLSPWREGREAGDHRKGGRYWRRRGWCWKKPSPRPSYCKFAKYGLS